MRKFVAIVTVSLPLAGCMTNETFSNQNIGTVAGAGVGILAGSMFGQGNGRLLAMAVGGAVGAWAGNQIGAKLDENARLKRQAAAEAALNRPVDAPPVSWSSDLPPEPAPAPQAAARQPAGDVARTQTAASQSAARPTAQQPRRAVGTVKTVGETAQAGRVCRTIEEEVDIAGEKEKVRSTFCRVNGDWVPQNA